MKKLDIQVGDKITYIQTRNVLENDGSIINPFYCPSLKYKEVKDKKVEIVANSDRKFGKDEEILKIERVSSCGWYTVYEKEEEILDKKEKEYLSAVIKPFRKNIKYIVKTYRYFSNVEYLCIVLKDNNIGVLPDFKPETMYKNMKNGKEYSLKELGLE